MSNLKKYVKISSVNDKMKRKTSEFSLHSMVTYLEWNPKAILHTLLRQVIRGRMHDELSCSQDVAEVGYNHLIW